MKGLITKDVEKVLCRRCSRCCTYFCMEIDEPEDKREYDDLAWIIAHEGVSIHVSGGQWELIVHNRCRHLLPQGGCAVYDRRPTICRSHEPGECEFDQEHIHDYDDVDRVICTMDELWAFRKELISKKRSEAAKKAARKKKRLQTAKRKKPLKKA